MGLSVWQIAIIAVVVLVLFGRGRISEMMGDFGKGISSFKKGMNEDVDDTSSNASASKAQIEAPAKEVGGAETTPSEAGDTAKS
ncbi:MAG: twin-arginine translocase TatA/TatE family subunit [Erythrobacter sp.]|uniref:twin-arginine translocase TatA/TatE family subunit n=1 Tax=Erythrobacter sp. TaxID=1042 RepID=UPI0026214988|nr:twin-arginine translocase TatA/TatE family subunit [Erythrobacter sp.]MDJ0979872.1 twin-arginine translocase TatA/TatE family subunit [Erythrobacter sp.]